MDAFVPARPRAPASRRGGLRVLARGAVVSLLCAAATLIGPTAAQATGGLYQVDACNLAGGVNNSWVVNNPNGTLFYAGGGCTLQSYTHWAYQNVPTSTPFWTNGAGYQFPAPSGTYLYNFYFDGYVNRYASSDWWYAHVASWDGLLGWSNYICGSGATACSWNSNAWIGVTPGYQVAINVSQGCNDGDGNCVAYNGYNVPWAEVQIRGARVSVVDQQDPTISGVSGTLLTSWRRGSQTVYWTGNDNTGVRTTVAYIWDGAWSIPAGTQTAHGCNYTYRVPCSNQAVGHWVNTASYSNGSHTIILRAFDASNHAGWGSQEGVTGLWGNWGDWSGTIYIDNAAPAAPSSMSDGGGADIEWTTSATQLTANWGAGSDGHSGVHSYHLCFSTATNCGGTVVFNQNIGNVTSRTATGLSLTQGTRYYACAYTVDNALDSAGNVGNTSGWTCSGGQRVDSVAPTTPGNRNDGAGADIDWQSNTTTIQANWTTSTDATSGLTRHERCVSTAVNCGGTIVSNWTSVGVATSFSLGSLSLTNGQIYYVALRAVDVAGNVTATASTNGVTIDTSAPPAAIQVSPPNDSSHATWPSLVATYDDAVVVSPGQITFQVCSDAACATPVTSGTSAAGLADGANGSWLPAIANGTYWWRVRGVDSAGNVGAWSGTRMVQVGTNTLSLGVDSTSRAMGAVALGASNTASTTVTVSSNAINGYQLLSSDTSNTWGISDGTTDVPDWTGTVAVPSVWAAGTFGYFGATVRSATGARLVKWGTPGGPYPEADYTNNRYAGLNTTPQVLHLRAGHVTAAETVVITWRFAPLVAQTAGNYAVPVTLTLIANP